MISDDRYLCLSYPMSFSLETLAFPILTNRRRYHTCFLRLPGEDKPIAGIEVIGKYYSYARLCPTREKAFETTSRLLDKKRLSIITEAPKGFVVWMWEPQATITQLTAKESTLTKKGFCKLLKLEGSTVPTCEIQTADLDKPLTAIMVSGQFYALLKSVGNREEASDLGRRMSQRGAKILVTPRKRGFSLWIHEPNAQVAIA
jgi:hypothetical protein